MGGDYRPSPLHANVTSSRFCILDACMHAVDYILITAGILIACLC